MTVLIGVDAGATKTAVAVSRDGTVSGRIEGPGAAVRPGRSLPAASRVAELARRALDAAGIRHADVLLVGAAGAGREPERTELHEALRGEQLATRVAVTTDIELVLAAMDDGPGAALIAGTGSIAVGRTADGTLLRQGGYGWQVGDEGGGYWIGRAALAEAAKAHDGRGEGAGLLHAIQSTLRADSFNDVIRWAAAAAPPEVAALTEPTLALAVRRDPAAHAIVQSAVEHLAGLVAALAGKLGVKSAPLALAGGLLRPEGGLRPLLEPLLTHQRGWRILPGQPDATVGALRLAARLVP